MARGINRLSARAVDTLDKPGRFADGGNLYLSISPNGGKRWVFFYRFDGRQREMGLGSASRGMVSLADARKAADVARKQLREGIDPLGAKREAAKAAMPKPTFGEFADEYIASHETAWRNAKHRAQWKMTLQHYAGPLRGLQVDRIDTEAVLKVLKPIWQEVPETASRLRGRIEVILDAARARGLRDGMNPAAWRGHLKSILPARQKLTRGHHAAMAYDAVPAFMTTLREQPGLGARALELAILTACRSGEVLGARWDEIDLDKALWTIPRERMKAGLEHRVPLSGAALALLRKLLAERIGEFVFPGMRFTKPLSNMAMAVTLRRMKVENATAHGFRSCFRDWAAERTSFSHTTAEHALAHRISDKAESAYRRGDELERRRQLMEAWAGFLAASPGAKVIPMTAAR